MAIAYDAFSSSAQGTGELSWEHTPVGTPKGVLVLVAVESSLNHDPIGTVTYGGQTMTEVELSPYQVTVAHSLHAFFLANPKSGKQPVVVKSLEGTYTRRAVAVTVTTAGGDVVVSDTITKAANNKVAEVVLENPETLNSIAIGEIIAAVNEVAKIDSNNAVFTTIFETDFGSNVGSWLRSTPGTSVASRTLEWAMTESVNYQAFAVLLSESTAPTAPTVTTEGATGVGLSSATAHGFVNPNGAATTWWIEYGTTEALGSKSATSELAKGSSSVGVEKLLSSLSQGTKYFYRVVAENSAGKTNGSIKNFTTTKQAAPVATTGEATAITQTGATLNGTVDPNLAPTNYYFEYGPTTSYGTRVPISYEEAVLATSGLRSLWGLGESSGAAVDAQGGHNGTPSSEGLTRAQASLLPNAEGASCKFDGSKGAFEIANHADLEIGTPVSYEFWAKVTVSASKGTVLTLGANSGEATFSATSRKLTLTKQGVVDAFFAKSGTTDGKPHLFAITDSGATIKLFIDGKEVEGEGPGATLAASSLAKFIGRYSGGEFFNGYLQYVSVYAAALSAATIAAHHEAAEAGSAGEGESPKAFSAVIDGLEPNTTYHYRIVAVNEKGEDQGEDATFTTLAPRASRVAVTQEFPSTQHHVIVRDPKTGKAIARWSEDEPLKENVLNGIQASGALPGGKKELKTSLPRDPRMEWPDLEGFLEIELKIGARNRVWHGRIGKAPRTDGDHMVIDGEAVGYAAALEDRTALRIGLLNSELGRWGEPSTERRKQLLEAGIRLVASTSVGQHSKDPEAVAPSVIDDFTNVETMKEATEAGEAHFQGGEIDLWRVMYDFAELSGAGANSNYENNMSLGTTDLFTTSETGTDHNSTAASQQSVTAPDKGYRFARLRDRLAAASEGEDLSRVFAWKNIKVLSWLAQSLTLQGEWPNVGFTAAQMLRLLVPEYSELRATEESVEDDGFVIYQGWWDDPGTLSRIVDELVKYGLYDWFVKDAKLFELRAPGTYGSNWQAYQGPSNFQESGTDTERLWDRIVVAYQDPDGSTRYVGYPGSGCEFEYDELQITDPNHPAVRSGTIREDLLVIQSISTAERSKEVGERWLANANELPKSGRAELSGFVQDDKGVFRPVAEVAEGDLLRFRDARDRSYRKIIDYDYDADSQKVVVDLDAPSDSFQALLERFDAVLVPGRG
jgi:hypothetical protein